MSNILKIHLEVRYLLKMKLLVGLVLPVHASCFLIDRDSGSGHAECMTNASSSVGN